MCNKVVYLPKYGSWDDPLTRTPFADDSIRKCLTRSGLLCSVMMKGQRHAVTLSYVLWYLKNKEELAAILTWLIQLIYCMYLFTFSILLISYQLQCLAINSMLSKLPHSLINQSSLTECRLLMVLVHGPILKYLKLSSSFVKNTDKCCSPLSTPSARDKISTYYKHLAPLYIC